MQVRFMGHTWPSVKVFVSEFLGAAIIFAIPIGAIWGYYIVTGQPLDFGG